MAGDRSELERLKRIRDQQIAARDPGKKQRKLQKTITRKHRRSSQPFSFGTMWAEVPSTWKGTLIASILGVLVITVLPIFVEGSWVVPTGLGLLGFMVLMGFLIGRAHDAKRNIEDLLR